MRKIINTSFILLLVINFLYVFTGVLFHSLQSEDAIGIWLFKAKAFYLEKGFPNQFLHNTSFIYSHQQYPLGLPFLFSLIYRLIGGVREDLALMIYPFLYLIIIFLIYKTLRRKVNITYALLFTYIYSMFSPLIAEGGRILAGNADIFITLIECLIVFILYKKRYLLKDYLLITILVMIASQIKLEGVFLSVIFLFLPITKKYKLSFFIVSITPFLLWVFTINVLKIPQDSYITLPSLNQMVVRLGIIITGILKELVNINNWYLFWPLVAVAIFIKGKLSFSVKNILLPTYGVIMVLYILTYLFSSTDTYKYVNSSFDRVLFQHSAIIFIFFFEKIIAVIA